MHKRKDSLPDKNLTERASVTKFRIFAATVFNAGLVVCACRLLADSKLTQGQQESLDKCNNALSSCNTGCNGKQGDALKSCQASCQRRYEECLERDGLSAQLPNSSGKPTPKPRPGPSAIHPPNKSNPTPTAAMGAEQTKAKHKG